MSKLYLSFLGTNNYVSCIYYQEGGEEVSDVRFVQEATVKIYCKDWGKTDRIRIFTTDEAYKKNWLDGGQTSDDGRPLAGLKSCLETLNQRADIQNVPIPDGKNEQEIWEDSTGSLARCAWAMKWCWTSLTPFARSPCSQTSC